MTSAENHLIGPGTRERLLDVHQLARRYSVYPLAFWTLLAGTLLVARAVYTGRAQFGFLVWNLFLAWIPYWASLWAELNQARSPGRWRALILPGILWLLFLPNAPYIVTDLIHLGQHRANVPLWYDAVLVCAFAWTGCLLGAVSLRLMQNQVRRYAGPLIGWAFALSVISLCGLGVYMGRVLRWNSWDVLARPHRIVGTLSGAALDPIGHWPALAASAVFAAFMLGCYVAFVTVQSPEPEPLAGSSQR